VRYRSIEPLRKKCGSKSAAEVRKKCGRSAEEVRNASASEEVRTAAEAAKKEEDERPCEGHFKKLFWLLLADYCPRAPRARQREARSAQ